MTATFKARCACGAEIEINHSNQHLVERLAERFLTQHEHCSHVQQIESEPDPIFVYPPGDSRDSNARSQE